MKEGLILNERRIEIERRRIEIV